MKSQLGVSYSINYVFTCGKRRVRICRNIYDQTNNTEYLVEEGSKGIVGGKQNEDLGNSRLHQEKQGVFQGQKKSSSSSSCFGGNRNRWVISSQKQLLLVGTAEGNQTADESRMGHHKSQQRSEAEENNKIGGGCMNSVSLGQCVKKCQNVECISSSQSSYLNQSKFNLTPSSTSDGKENSYDLSISQNSGQNLRLITDFYLHEISEVRGVLQSILLLRIEDTFYDLDEQVGTSNKEETTHQCNHQSDNRMHNHNHIYATSLKTSPAHKNYIYNRKVLNGFLFKQNGLYMQFASPSLLADDLSRFSKYSSYYPNSTSLTLKNDNFSFQFLITQTDEGIFVDGALESRSHLVKAEEKLTYHVSVLQQEVAQIKMHEMNTIPQQSTNQINKSTLLNESSKGSSDHQKRIHQHIEQEDDEEDTQCSSLTIQINNNRNGNYQNDSENNFQQGRIRNSSQGQSKKKSSTKKGLKHNQQYSAETEKKQTKKVNKYSTNQSNEDCQNDINLSNQKKASQISKKAALCKQHKPVQSSTYNEDEEEEEILKHCVSSSSKMQTNTNRYYPNDEIDKEDDDNEQNSWDSHSKISTQQHDQSHHKNYDLQSHNDELNSSLNNNIPVQPKKNVVKNFVKAFRNFVNNWGDEGRIMQAIGITTHEELINFRLQYKKYESIHKFNNTFIKALILNDPFKPVFDYFVNEVAWEWLDKSQVNNKKAHKDVLRDYIKATQDPSKIDEIHSLRTRNRQSCKKIKC